MRVIKDIKSFLRLQPGTNVWRVIEVNGRPSDIDGPYVIQALGIEENSSEFVALIKRPEEWELFTVFLKQFVREDVLGICMTFEDSTTLLRQEIIKFELDPERVAEHKRISELIKDDITDEELERMEEDDEPRYGPDNGDIFGHLSDGDEWKERD